MFRMGYRFYNTQFYRVHGFSISLKIVSMLRKYHNQSNYYSGHVEKTTIKLLCFRPLFGITSSKYVYGSIPFSF